MYTYNFLLIMNYKFILNEYISIFLLRNSNVVFFSYLVKEYKYWKKSTNTANIVLLSADQLTYIFLFKQ